MKKLPILPLRDIVIFPDMIVPLFVGREKSVVALEEIMKNEDEQKSILLATQKDPLTEYKKEAFNYFTLMLARIRHRVVYFVLRSKIILQ